MMPGWMEAARALGPLFISRDSDRKDAKSPEELLG